MTPERKQRLLAFVADDAGRYYYDGPIDGLWGLKSQAAEQRFLRDFLGEEQPEALWTGIRHFRREEFGCKCKGKCGGFPVEPDWELVKILDEIREELGQPIVINSAIRCSEHNSAVGGVQNSQHLLGKAADIHAPGISPERLAVMAEKYLTGRGGIGVYDTFVHIDVRTTKARWRG